MVKTATSKKSRSHRTAEQRIADLEAKIAGIQAREAAKKVKASPEGKALQAARRAVKKALEAARAAGDNAMADAVEKAHGAIERFAEKATEGSTAKEAKPKAA